MKVRSCCRGVYRMSLHLYPLQFRQRFGGEMLQVFDDRYREIEQSSGTRGLVRFGAQVLFDLVWSAYQENFGSAGPSPRAATAGIAGLEGVPAFLVLSEDAPHANTLVAGTVVSLLLFGSATAAIENWRSPNWRGHIAAGATPPRLSGERWSAPVGPGKTPGQVQPAGMMQPPPAQIDVSASLMAQFNSARVVALAEIHGAPEDSQLRLNLIHHVGFPEKVRYILVEFANSRHQAVLDRYIDGEDVPASDVRKVWRDITTPGGADSPVYAQFLTAVRSLNRRLPVVRRVRVLAGDPPIDWNRINSRDDWRRIASSRDAFAADLLSQTVLEKGHKALLIFGAGHIWRKTSGGPVPPESTLVSILDRRYSGQIFTVLPIADGENPCQFSVLRGTHLGSSDANDLISRQLQVPLQLFPQGTKMADIADACVCRAGTSLLSTDRGPAMDADPVYAAEKARRLRLLAPPRN